MIIMSLDYSMAKTGYSVCRIEDKNIFVIESGTIHSDKNLDIIPRISNMLDDIWKVYDKYNPDIYIREEAFIGK